MSGTLAAYTVCAVGPFKEHGAEILLDDITVVTEAVETHWTSK